MTGYSHLYQRSPFWECIIYLWSSNLITSLNNADRSQQDLFLFQVCFFQRWQRLHTTKFTFLECIAHKSLKKVYFRPRVHLICSYLIAQVKQLKWLKQTALDMCRDIVLHIYTATVGSTISLVFCFLFEDFPSHQFSDVKAAATPNTSILLFVVKTGRSQDSRNDKVMSQTDHFPVHQLG